MTDLPKHQSIVAHNGSKSDFVVVTALVDEESPLLLARNDSSDQDQVGHNKYGVSARTQRLSLYALTCRLFIPFLLYCLAQGAVLAPKLNVVLMSICVKTGSRLPGETIKIGDICKSATAHAETAKFMSCAHLISGVLSAICSPRIGALSDRYGRKPLIAFSLTGILVGDIVSLVAALFPGRFPVYLMLVEFIVGGLTGAFLTTLALVQSYTADVTTHEQRTRAFSILHAVMYTGHGLGPIAGALFVRTIGHETLWSLFCVAGSCHLAFICYVLLGLPESRLGDATSPKTRSERLTQTTNELSKWRRWLQWLTTSIDQPFKIFMNRPVASKSRAVAILTFAVIDTIAFGVQIGLPSLLVLYSEHRLGWKNLETNLFLSATNITRAVVLGLFVPMVIHLAGSKKTSVNVDDSKTIPHKLDQEGASNTAAVIWISLALEVVGQIGFAVSRTSSLFAVSGIIAAVASPISPLAQSLMTLHIEADRLGELFGAVAFLHSVSRALIPALMQLIYGLTVGDVDGAIFWILGLLFSVVLMSSLWSGSRLQQSIRLF